MTVSPPAGPGRESLRRPSNFTGCLLGGAVGDALGAPIEFFTLDEIRREFGSSGLRDFAPAFGRTGAVTDDTQMTLFTAEGLLRGWTRGAERGIVDLPELVYRSYLRWLITQGGLSANAEPSLHSGWLIELPELHSRRAPGTTCLTALETGQLGTREAPLNDSKGCGGVMRVAPAGLVGDDPFELGCRLAALTHGHPSGYLSAGVFAAVIAGIVGGTGLTEAIAAATERLQRYPDHDECLQAVEAALWLSRQAPVSADTVERLGAGWVAEEALAIALYCALTAESFEEGVLLAVNHGGDSDSTGSLTGNLLGALLGAEAIPIRWIGPLELHDEIEQVAQDLFARFVLCLPPEEDDTRYPGW